MMVHMKNIASFMESQVQFCQFCFSSPSCHESLRNKSRCSPVCPIYLPCPCPVWPVSGISVQRCQMSPQMTCLKRVNRCICMDVGGRIQASQRLSDLTWPPTCFCKEVAGYLTECASIALNDESWVNQWVMVGIDLLGQLKNAKDLIHPKYFHHCAKQKLILSLSNGVIVWDDE